MATVKVFPWAEEHNVPVYVLQLLVDEGAHLIAGTW